MRTTHFLSALLCVLVGLSPVCGNTSECVFGACPGVPPSSGAATPECSSARELSGPVHALDAAAPGDGRTPLNKPATGERARPANKPPAAKAAAPFQWVNKLPAARTPLLQHGTFFSQKNQTDVGFYIYLPPDYDAPKNAQRRFPVVYYLHGGRPGGEHKSIGMATFFDAAMRAGRVPPMIYVFVNGGAMSHYDFPAKNSFGETAFVQELIPHIDATYRTIAKREGRGLEGFSQGGRGTGRIMFKYPELFCSAAPMGGGQQHEKHASENGGRETGGTQFEPGHNTYDLARAYLPRRNEYPLRILVAVGKKDFNYEANLDWMKHLETLGIPFEKAIAGDAPHSAAECYRNLGDAIMLFHARNFIAAPTRTPKP